MKKQLDADARIETGVRNLDALFASGFPKGSTTIISGSPGAGKTILTQEICFRNATPQAPSLYFSTLSEPTAKTLRYLKKFSFFDAKRLDEGMHFVDLGVLLRTKGLAETSQIIMERVKQIQPAIVVIDSFKTFDDLAKSPEDLRKFDYELAVNLMAWETTTFLIGEYEERDLHANPLFSIVDGLIVVSQREQSGEQQRFLQVVKMRGTDHSRDEHAFLITQNGVEIFAPRVTIQRADRGPTPGRCQTGIAQLDALLGDGIPRGSSLLIAGVAGTGKTALLLEFIYRGAQAGEKGIVFSFEETEERLRAAARGLGWNFDEEIERGMVEIVFIPQPNILVERDLLMIHERVKAGQARRVAIDSVSVFLHKVKDPQLVREKTFQLASVIQNTQAVGFFATDIPYGSTQISRFGVEETVVDGIILLSSTEEALERHRYLEVYKLRNTSHLKGRHSMVIGPGGITVFPRYEVKDAQPQPQPSTEPVRRLSWGVPRLDELCGGGLLERSATLVSGSAGSGKSTLGLQFILAGVKLKESGLYISFEEEFAQILKTAETLGLPLQEALDQELCQLVHLSREQVRSSQFRAILEDHIRAKKIRRLVLDGISDMVIEDLHPQDLRAALFSIVARFKSLEVTSILTFEAGSMHATGIVTGHGVSPAADNIVLLRYVQAQGEYRPTLAVVKTRGSAHDRGTYYLSIAKGGIRIGDRIDAAIAPTGKHRKELKRAMR